MHCAVTTYLVSLIDVLDKFGLKSFSAVKDGECAEKLGIEVEGTLDAILVEQFNKTDIIDVSIVKAHRIQDKARNVGFDWEQRDQVWEKVHEEFTELKAEIDKMDADKMEAEFGDLFFSLINAARLYKINPDNALERTNQKFIRRFNYLEEHTIKEGKSLKEMSLNEMDQIWNEAKSKGL